MSAAPDPRLLAHAQDLLARAEGGQVTYTAFLTPAEQYRLGQTLGRRDEWIFAGGYDAAERKRLFCLPPYMQGADEQMLSAYLADTFAETLIPLEIRGSGYRDLAHRDYLGAILNLGLERSAVGDLCVLDKSRAVLFCDRVIADFLCENLTRAANDAVRATPVVLPDDFDGGHKIRRITDTVASPRADSVAAALANLSRERAQALFREGMVEIDYEPADKPDRTVGEGTILVIRGKGKFVIRSLAETTKKGRVRLAADQYL